MIERASPVGNFDPVAKWYDRLSKWVFGAKLDAAKGVFLSQFPRNATILIPGAGTAVELTLLRQTDFAGKVIVLDLSAHMLELAKERWDKLQPAAFKVSFIQAENELTEYPPADVICTHFFLDLFEGREWQRHITALEHALTPGGLWLWADFVQPTSNSYWYQKLLLKVMYSFFRLTCGIQASKLEPVSPWLIEKNYEKVAHASWQSGFIQATCWRKPSG